MFSTIRNRFCGPFLSRRKVLGCGTMTASSLALSGLQEPKTESLERYLNRLEREYQGITTGPSGIVSTARRAGSTHRQCV